MMTWFKIIFKGRRPWMMSTKIHPSNPSSDTVRSEQMSQQEERGLGRQRTSQWRSEECRRFNANYCGDIRRHSWQRHSCRLWRQIIDDSSFACHHHLRRRISEMCLPRSAQDLRNPVNLPPFAQDLRNPVNLPPFAQALSNPVNLPPFAQDLRDVPRSAQGLRNPVNLPQSGHRITMC